MRKTASGVIVETPTEARQVERGPTMFNVLAAGLGLAVIALVAAYKFFL